MIRSGIAPLDASLGGLLSGRLHLLTGGVGTGKTSACLHFLAAGLEDGESAALLTHDRSTELHSHANHIGLDLNGAMRAGRFVALRYRAEFARHYSHAPSPDWVIADLGRLLRDMTPPWRIAIDPATPFLADGSSSGAGLDALVEFLDASGATVLCTWPCAITDGADRRLDALVERAATIAACTASLDHWEMHVVRARGRAAPPASIPFRILPGAGLVATPESERDGAVVQPTVIRIANAP